MNNKSIENKSHGRIVPKINFEPQRVPARMEGVVKNVGTKNVKKQKKGN